jgi:signal transduction histidine kinase/ActR/RegA family two-component response regulator
VSVKTSDRPVAKLRRLFLRRSVPFALFAIGCGLSLAAGWYLSYSATETAELQMRAEFVGDAKQIRRQIQSGVNSYIEVVRAAAVLLSADTEINGSEFRRFVQRLELPERYPGLDGIGFAQCMRSRDVRRVLRSYDLDGNRLQLWPQSKSSEHCPVVFLEPSRPANRALRGFDLATDPRLVEAMATARDSGQPVVSHKIEPLTDGDVQHGNVFVLIPVYRASNAADASVELKRRSLIGFVFSPFHSERLIEHVVELTGPLLAFQVFDSAESEHPMTLGGSPVMPVSVRYESLEQVDVMGKPWLVSVQFAGSSPVIITPEAQQALFGGLVLSFMLFLVTRAQARAWETAARHEAELRASAEALKEREAQANAANRAKDEFLATLSHELRTPLNVVLGWVGMLRHNALPEDRVPRALEIIERNARQQSELIDDLLDVSRIITGKLRLNVRPMELVPIVSSVAEALRPSADAKGVSLQVTAGAKPGMVIGDPDRLRQTIWNLLSNAVKFTPGGGVVSAAVAVDQQHVRLTIRDSGVGIAPEFLPHVFERFRQADSTTTRAHSGVGLGLAIVRELIELHGGSVEAFSEGSGKGAEFVITLPAAPATEATAAQTPARATAPPLDGVRVLLVDDEPNTLEMLTEALRIRGAHVTAADSAQTALDAQRQSPADVIVSDIAMPGEDGFWLMNRVRALPGRAGRTPAVALTALARHDDRARAMHAGFTTHMAKPVRLDHLQAVVAELAGASVELRT